MKENETLKISIPKKVLYCKKIPRGAKLLYIEISMWCERDDCCYQRNIYFSKLFGVSVVTISKWVKELREQKFIKCKYKKYLRIIFLRKVGKI